MAEKRGKKSVVKKYFALLRVWCTRAKSYFKQNGISFKTIDITKDQKAAKDCQNHGCRGVPPGAYWWVSLDPRGDK